MSKSATDLATVTGLKAETAEVLYNKFGGYGPALASFVQSLHSIPPHFYKDSAVHRANAAAINAELREIYRQARDIRQQRRCEDKEAWKAFNEKQLASKAPTGNAATPPPPSFGFNSTAPSSTPSVPISFGFGAPASTSTAGVGGAAVSSFGKPTAAVEVSSEETKPVPKFVDAAKHYTGPLLDMPTFWEKEVVERATLFNLDAGFMEKNRDTLSDRVHKWLKNSEFFNTPVKYVAMDDKDEYYARVIIKDAERTFFAPEHREKFYMFLYAMYFEFGSYGQAMSYLAGICLLVLNEQETATVLRKVRKVIPGHWAAEAVGFATSAWVVEHFMQTHFPDVAQHFQRINFWPDTYLQKILSGLCVHVLRFEDLFVFLDAFMDGGFNYLLRFCMSIIEHFHQHLLRLDSTKINELYEIMRLDSKAVDRADVQKILQRAATFELNKELSSSTDVIRSEVFEKKVNPRLQKAPKTEAFEPCEICEKNKPKFFSEELGAVCAACKALHPDATFEDY